jgi:PhnB protein
LRRIDAIGTARQTRAIAEEAPMTTSGVPKGHNSVSPYIVVQGVARLIDFLTATFRAEEVGRLPGPNGTISHAEVRIGDTIVMMGEAPEDGRPASAHPAMVHVYVADVDAAYERALVAGAKSTREPTDMFYGDRISMVIDAFGNTWAISTHKEDVSQEEMERRMASLKKA